MVLKKGHTVCIATEMETAIPESEYENDQKAESFVDKALSFHR